MTKEKLPKRVLDMIGTTQLFSGHVLNKSKCYREPTEFDVIDARYGSAIIYDMKTMKAEHPTFDLLLKKEGMKRAQWSRSYPITEITLDNEK